MFSFCLPWWALIWHELAQVLCMLSWSLWACVSPCVCCLPSTVPWVYPPPLVLHFLFCADLWALRGRGDIHVPFRAEHSKATSCLHSEQLWASDKHKFLIPPYINWSKNLGYRAKIGFNSINSTIDSGVYFSLRTPTPGLGPSQSYHGITL